MHRMGKVLGCYIEQRIRKVEILAGKAGRREWEREKGRNGEMKELQGQKGAFGRL